MPMRVPAPIRASSPAVLGPHPLAGAFREVYNTRALFWCSVCSALVLLVCSACSSRLRNYTPTLWQGLWHAMLAQFVRTACVFGTISVDIYAHLTLQRSVLIRVFLFGLSVGCGAVSRIFLLYSVSAAAETSSLLDGQELVTMAFVSALISSIVCSCNRNLRLYSFHAKLPAGRNIFPDPAAELSRSLVAAFYYALHCVGYCLGFVCLMLLVLQIAPFTNIVMGLGEAYLFCLISFIHSFLRNFMHEALHIILTQPVNFSKLGIRASMQGREDGRFTQPALMITAMQLGWSEIYRRVLVEKKVSDTSLSPYMYEDMYNDDVVAPWQEELETHNLVVEEMLYTAHVPTFGPPFLIEQDVSTAFYHPDPSLIRALAMLDFARLARHQLQQPRREQLYAMEWNTVCAAACGVVNSAVLRLQLMTAYMRIDVLQHKAAPFTSSARFTGNGQMGPFDNQTTHYSWASDEVLRHAKAARSKHLFSEFENIIRRVVHFFEPMPRPFTALQVYECVCAIEGLSILLERATVEDQLGFTQNTVTCVLHSFLALQLALRDYGHVVQLTNEKLSTIPRGSVAKVFGEVHGLGVALDEGLTRVCGSYASILTQYTFPPAYADELQAVLVRLG